MEGGTQEDAQDLSETFANVARRLLGEHDVHQTLERTVQLAVGTIDGLCNSTDSLGALNLYSKCTNAFDDDARGVGLVFASHAAVALTGAQIEENLRRAVQTRTLIGQAQGILMQRFGLSAD